MVHCRFEEHCRQLDHTTAEPAQATDRGLCLACETHGKWAIGQLATDYVGLSVQLPRTSPSIGGTGVTVKRAEAPIPLRPEIDALMRRIVSTLDTWERDVRYVARLSTPAGNVRPGWLVNRATRTLTEHYSALLALRLPASALIGADGVVALTALHHQAAAVVGESRTWEWRQLPCPAAPLSDGCGEMSLGQWIGSDRVECAGCGWCCTTAEYSMYVSTLIPRSRGLA